MSDHALLSPSSAKRWIHCPPSARICAQFPDTSSQYAAEGTLAHSIAELKLTKHFTAAIGPRKYSAALKTLKAEPQYKPERDGYTDAYLEYIKSIAMRFPSSPYVAVEKRVALGEFVPESFGRVDCIVLAQQELHVIDFKYGKSVQVEAEKNPQLMLYGLGALSAYCLIYPIQDVHIHIFQPRIGGADEWSISADDLRAWAAEIQPRAKLAFDGGGEFACGEWCQFCEAKGQCRACAEQQLSLANFQYRKPPLLTPAEVGEAITTGRQLSAWLKAVEETALSALLLGEEVPGWKAVEGRAVRQWTDPEAAFAAAIQNGVNEDMLYERKPLTLAAVEKTVDKTFFDSVLAPYVTKPRGKPTLAPESDGRTIFDTATHAADVFGGIENE
jgi:hypothetical protein